MIKHSVKQNLWFIAGIALASHANNAPSSEYAQEALWGGHDAIRDAEEAVK